MIRHCNQGDVVQGPVQLPVPAAVQPVSLDLPRGGRERSPTGTDRSPLRRDLAVVLCALARRLGTRRSYPGRTFVDRTLGLSEGYRLTLKDFDDGGLVSRTLRRGTVRVEDRTGAEASCGIHPSPIRASKVHLEGLPDAVGLGHLGGLRAVQDRLDLLFGRDTGRRLEPHR